MRRFAVNLAWRIGRRGSCLLWLALLDLLYGFSMAVPPPEARLNPTLRFIQEVAPLPVWAGMWIAVGLVCLVCAFLQRDRVAFAMAMALKVLWGLTFLIGWVIADLERGWVSAAIFLPMAAWVMVLAGWREFPFFLSNREADQS